MNPRELFTPEIELQDLFGFRMFFKLLSAP